MGIRTKFNSMGVSATSEEPWDEKTFKFSAIPITMTNHGVVRINPSNTSEPYINPITIDWGDGTVETYSEGYMNHNYNEDYRNPKDITITSDTGKMPLLKLETFNVNVKKINTPLMECYNGQNLETNFTDVFSGFTGTTLPKNLFIKNPQITILDMGFERAELTMLSPDLLSNLTNLTSLENCFNNIKGIHKDAFKNCTKVTNFSYCFNGAGLTEIPEGLFDNCINSVDFKNCFSYNYNLVSVPDNIFDSIINNVSNLSNCFSGCRSLALIPELWNKFNNIPYDYCFMGCDNASNYPDCPYDWGGPTSIKLNVTPSDYQSEFTTGNSFYEVISNSKDFAYTNYSGKINYRVYKDNYSTYLGSVEKEQKTETITLKERNIPVSITTTPSNANIDITVYDETTSEIGSANIMVGEGAELTYKIYLDGYNTQEKTITINDATTLNIELKNVKTIYDLTYPFTDSGLNITTNLLNNYFMIDSENESITNEDSYSNKHGYIIIPPISNETNINIIIDTGYEVSGHNYYYVYLGTQEYSPSYNTVGDEVTDGHGQYIIAYYSSNSSMPTTKRVQQSVALEPNTQYYINVGATGYRSGGHLDLYSVKVVADDTTT